MNFQVMNFRTSHILLFLVVFFTGCSKYQAKIGDLLFQDIDCGPMCEAIEAVTHGYNGANLSHVGLVVKKGDSLVVLEAVSDGILLTEYDDFISRSVDNEGNPKIVVGRLTRNMRHIIPEAVNNALKYLNTEYDYRFLIDNDTYYCSELLYTVFKDANNGTPVFNLAPMTFKIPGSDSYYSIWEAYYNEIGMPIPEGLPGINPGGMSCSPNIKIVAKLGEVSGYSE